MVHACHPSGSKKILLYPILRYDRGPIIKILKITGCHMKRTLSLTLLSLLCSGLLSTTHASNLQPEVNRIINNVDPSIHMGIKVVDLDTGEVLYQRNANQPLTPASNMKLYSNAAALLALGPDYRFRTTLSTAAPLIEKGTLKGNLYLTFPGDPSFRSVDLNNLFSQLEPFGVRRIEGNIIIDSTASVRILLGLFQKIIHLHMAPPSVH
jgi:D-alanyl-D-alanine carboxypeptidase/D-alanyl-D-alanine-endopeptidase (penicillin-binding protein 4)